MSWGTGAELTHPVDQSEIRQLSIVTSSKTETDMNALKNDVGKPTRAAAATSEANASGAVKAQPMDRWFDDQLNRLFNDVSSEPLPPDLADLVGKLRAQGSKPDDK